ncbi:MAG: hypothetical protein K6U11_13705 [bacterium]|nr:hypothetical protein [bacterium]
MSIITMYDYLPNATPDYTGTLSVDPQEIMVISGEKSIEIHRGIGIAEERVIFSTQTRFQVRLQWQVLSEADHSTLFDFYHNYAKGCGMGRTFYWQPPAQYDNHTYVVRFDSPWESFLRNYKIYGVASLVLVVLGKKTE